MRKFVVAIAMVAVFGAVAEEAKAQVSFGAQANWASEVDIGLGARAKFAVPVENLSIVPSFDYFFPSSGIEGISHKWMELNVNAHYAFPLANYPTLLPYAGAGLNFARSSVKADVELLPGVGFSGSGSANETGLNLLGGVQFGSFGSLQPFAELRYSTVGTGQIIISGGINF